MTAREKVAWAASLAALGGTALALGKVDVHTSMEDFVVDASQSERLGLIGRLAESKRARIMVFAVGGGRANGEAAHRAAAAELRRRLESSGLFTWVRGSAGGGDVEAFYRLYFPRRFGFVELPASGDPLEPWLRARIAGAKQALAGPMGPLVARTLTEDPIQAFPDLLARLQAGTGRVRENAGQLQTEDGRWSIVFAQARAPALLGAQQTPLIELVETAVKEIGDGGRVRVLWTGVNRFAVETERSIRRELPWIGVLSAVPVFLIYLLAFRSARPLLAGLVVTGLALGSAVLVCQLVFGKVHGLALTFGTSLVGVTIDYAVHYAVHLRAPGAAEKLPRMLRLLRKATATGAATTAAAFAALAGGRLPIFQQFALLGFTGAWAGFAFTHLLLPRLVPASTVPEPRGDGARPDVLLATLERHARAVLMLTVPLVIAIVGLARWRWQDDVTAFKTPLPALEQETEELQRVMGQDGRAPTVVVTGPDDESTLQLHERVVERLVELEERKALGAHASVAPALISAETQRQRVRRLAESEAVLEPAYRAALRAEGFREGSFPAWKDVVATAGPPLTPRDLAGSPLGYLLDTWRLDLPRGVAYLIDLKDLADEKLVAATLESLPGVWVIRPAGLLEETYRMFRGRVVGWLGLGAGLVVAIICVLYRRPRLILAGVLPALVGGAATLGFLALLGIPGNLLHVVALLLVLGLGIDYGVFLVETHGHSVGLSLRGILLGASTTCLSFAALAFSRNAAVHTLGLTASVGILFTVLTCPLVILLLERARGRK